MKLKGFGIIAAVAFLAACSSDTVDVATTLDESLKDATDIVSFEGRSFVGEDISIDFVGAKTALAKIDFIDEVVEDEVLCSYRATRDSLILQVKKAPLGDDGRLYSEEEFIRMWNSDSKTRLGLPESREWSPIQYGCTAILRRSTRLTSWRQSPVK